MRGYFLISENECKVPFADLCRRNEEYRSQFVGRTYEPGQLICSGGAKITHFGIVEKGLLRTEDPMGNGGEQCRAYFEAKDIVPEFLCFSENGDHSQSLVAEEKTTVLWAPVDVMEEMLEKDRMLVCALFRYISRRGLKNRLCLNCLDYQSVGERIACWIVGMHRIAPSESIYLPCSRQMFAHILRVDQTSLDQELELMEKEGYFLVKDREVQDLDEWRLNSLIRQKRTSLP